MLSHFFLPITARQIGGREQCVTAFQHLLALFYTAEFVWKCLLGRLTMSHCVSTSLRLVLYRRACVKVSVGDLNNESPRFNISWPCFLPADLAWMCLLATWMMSQCNSISLALFSTCRARVKVSVGDVNDKSLHSNTCIACHAISLGLVFHLQSLHECVCWQHEWVTAIQHHSALFFVCSGRVKVSVGDVNDKSLRSNICNITWPCFLPAELAWKCLLGMWTMSHRDSTAPSTTELSICRPKSDTQSSKSTHRTKIKVLSKEDQGNWNRKGGRRGGEVPV